MEVVVSKEQHDREEQPDRNTTVYTKKFALADSKIAVDGRFLYQKVLLIYMLLKLVKHAKERGTAQVKRSATTLSQRLRK
jgi:hypothetical protein